MNEKPTSFRWQLAVVMFLISLVAYMDRVNLSVATPAIMREFSFTKMDIGLLQTIFFAGYAVMQVPGGMLAEFFGHRRIVTLSVAWWSVFTSLTAVGGNFLSFAVIRGLFGLGEGPIFPAFNIFVYRWFHKAEKAMGFSWVLAGAFVGPVFGPALTVTLMLAWGWRSVFVAFGAVGFVMAVAWYFLATEGPHQSRHVNAQELAHINTGRDDAPEQEKQVAPWKEFMRSGQFWAIGIQYFVADYIMYVFLAWLPLYLMEAQKFSLQKMGMAASFPWAALAILVFAGGYFSDKLIARGVSKATARSFFGIAGLTVCCVALYLGAVAATPFWNVVWMTVSLGSLGLTFSASWAACIDIGGRFAGSVSGWMNFWGNVGGIAAPTVTAWVATHYGWQAAILLTSASAVIGAVAWLAVKPDAPLVRRAQADVASATNV